MSEFTWNDPKYYLQPKYDHPKMPFSWYLKSEGLLEVCELTCNNLSLESEIMCDLTWKDL